MYVCDTYFVWKPFSLVWLVKLLEAPSWINSSTLWLIRVLCGLIQWSWVQMILWVIYVCAYLGDLLAVFTEQLDLSENDDTSEPLFVRKLVPKIPNTAEKRLKNEVFYNCKFEGEGSSLTLSEFRYFDTSWRALHDGVSRSLGSYKLMTLWVVQVHA